MNAGAHPPPELHLPGLPDVPVTLGLALPGQAARAPVPWGWRLREGLSTYLPLLLMALLASGTWWLVKHTPTDSGSAKAKVVRHEPDYTMRGFSLTRFTPDGKYSVRIEGDVLRHYPDNDQLEIDGARIHAVAPDGRVTRASAKRALANGDASEVQLLGGARVEAEIGPDDRLLIESEFLHAHVRFERLRTHLPVRVQRGAAITHASGLEYDHRRGDLRLAGPVRASLPADAGRTPKP